MLFSQWAIVSWIAVPLYQEISFPIEEVMQGQGGDKARDGNKCWDDLKRSGGARTRQVDFGQERAGSSNQVLDQSSGAKIEAKKQAILHGQGRDQEKISIPKVKTGKS